MTLTPKDSSLIRRALTVLVTMMLVSSVIAVHSFRAGHAPMAHREPTPASSPQHLTAMTTYAPASEPAPTQRVTARLGPTSETADGISAICLAALPALALLVALALRRLGRRLSMVSSRRGVPQQWVGIRCSPPRRTTPSLSQLCVLRT